MNDAPFLPYRSTTKIELVAAGDIESANNGYYTWARFGFDGELSKSMSKKASRELGATVNTVQDIMSLPEGKEWWRKYGSALDMEFDLSDDSKSMGIFKDYLKSKGKDLKTAVRSTAFTSESVSDMSFTKWDGVNRELLELKPKNYEAFKKAYRKMVEDNNSLNDVTNRLLTNAKKAEPGITKDLQKILKDTHGTIGYDVGNGKTALDFRLKGGDSLKRKITSDFTKGVDLDYIEAHVYDNVRYTDLVDSKHFVDDYIKVQNRLESEGYKIVRVKNTLGDKTAAYRGLNTVVESPDGYKFELQFHTPESIDIKERVHKLYEKQRLDSTSAADKARLNAEMIEISSSLPDIKNIDAIKPFDTFKGEKAIKASLDGD